MTAYVADTETNGLLDVVHTVHCLGLLNLQTGEKTGYADHPGYRPIREGLALLAKADMIVWHNGIKFDMPVLKKLYPAWATTATIRDTLTSARLIWPDLYPTDKKMIERGTLPAHLAKRHSLEAWGYRLKCNKGDYKGGWETFSREMFDYMLQDLEVTAKLWRRIQSENYSERAIQIEHDFQDIIFEQETLGFPFDFPAAVVLHGKLAKRKLELETQLIETFGSWWQGSPATFTRDMKRKRPDLGMRTVGKLNKRTGITKYTEVPVIETVAAGAYTKLTRVTFNPGSRDHIAKVLIERGWKPKLKTEGGKWQVDEEILSGLTFPEAKLCVEYLTVEKREGALSDGKNAWLRLAKLHPDGVYRMHGQVNTMGTTTSRCTHSGPNVGQVPSVKNAKGVVPYGYECRALFMAGPGYVQVGADASGLQLRCLAHYLFPLDAGNYANILVGGDIHTANSIAAGLYKPDGTVDRDRGKRLVYAYLFGGGDGMLGEIIDPYAKPAVQKRLGKEARAKLVANTPGLALLLKGIEKAVKRGWLKGLDGRKVIIRSPHSALNFLLQSAEAIIMKEATIILHRKARERGWVHGKHFRQVAHVHDEIQSEVLPDIAQEFGALVVKSIVEAGLSLDFRCPLAGEFKPGKNWAECH